MNTNPRALRPIHLEDRRPGRNDVLNDAVCGLASRPKRLPSKYFYDARGSALFERICRLPEYYPTRTELAIMRDHVGAIAAALGPDVRLVEYGSGSGLKTRLLLGALATPVAYVPVEISRSALAASVARLGRAFRSVEMLPVCADFTRPITLPRAARVPRQTVVYFPGSTLGNFAQDEALRLLRQMRAEAMQGGG
ncbi:MAG: L-histidine N(alpha)-methyltransferase, partial [Rhodanobacteraceae bacterium]